MANLLRQGSRGPQVTQLQNQLNAAGGSRQAPLTPDGIFGAKTRARVVEFQSQKGLAADGIVGPQTQGALPAAGPGNGAGRGAPGAPGGPGAPGPIGTNPPGEATPNQGRVIAAITGAAIGAHFGWRSTAVFRNITVNAATAIGTPGCVSGPALGPLILGNGQVSALSGNERKIAEAAAGGISECFGAYASRIMVPGLPWYPMLANFPGPAAPPTPNVPTSVMSLSSASVGQLSAGSLNSAMSSRLAPGIEGAGTILSAVAATVGAHFAGWLAGSSVKGVLGFGSVPTFAPPVVIMGPVVGGSTISTGGHF